MQPTDYQYWQSRLGEQGRYQSGEGFGPRGMYQGQMPPYGGGWVGPDRDYYRAVEGPGRVQTYWQQPVSAFGYEIGDGAPWGGRWGGTQVGPSQQWGSQQSGPHTGRGPKNYQRSDERIREDVCEQLTQHGGVDASDIDVQVQNGEVTLTGTVENRQQKRMAEDAAESVQGVKDVQNQLRLQQGGQGQQSSQGQQSNQSQMNAAANGGTPARAGR